MTIGSFIAGKTRALVALATTLHIAGLGAAVASAKRQEKAAENARAAAQATEGQVQALLAAAIDATDKASIQVQSARKHSKNVVTAAVAEAKSLGRKETFA
ncbi:hypothetical protein CPT_Percy10 [Caulobacter phage Percy]|uniref:Uncharacterized protein n=1 Tax=Caulobacter phage Percy TaxID=1701809 RepID=A0A0M5M193_9CAUD|nr:hypothetical protein CPT_Percy10 [Caulobacter phage Percy]ALF01644.1 hypothetical protein CPT_Percy10 [Caulobacter phage Percy]